MKKIAFTWFIRVWAMPALLGAFSLQAQVDLIDTVTITAPSPAASEAGPDPGLFEIRRSGPTNFGLAVFYRVSGTASNGLDYETLPGAVVIAPGSLAALVPVKPIDDALVEGPETVVLQIVPSLLLCPTPACGYDIGWPSNATVTINTLRPYSAWSVPITRRDPGPDGILGNADDGGRVTLFDYSAAFRGAAFVNTQIVNATNADRYDSIEGTVTKRFSSRWTGQVSYFVVKNHRWLASVFTSPNDEFFPLDETWTWAGSVSGSYRLPAGVTVSGFLQSKNGVLGQRTYIFRQVDPDGGPSIAQNGNTTIRLEPYGSQKLSAQNILNLRGSKDFSLGGGRRFEIDVDVFNVLNAATPTNANFQAGPSFGFITGVIPARIARLGGRFRF